MLFDLDQGLRLDDSGTLLAWHTPLQDLRRTGRPEVYTLTTGALPGTVLFWRARSCLGGLQCHVTTAFGTGEYSVATLRGLRLVPLFDVNVGSLRAAFGWTQARMFQRLGEPLSYEAEDTGGKAIWRLGDVVVRHEFDDALLWGEDRVLVYLE
jgi:hypothetical protein